MVSNCLFFFSTLLRCVALKIVVAPFPLACLPLADPFSCAHCFQAPATQAKGLVGSQPRFPGPLLPEARGEQERTLGTRLSREHRTSEKRTKGVMGTSAERERRVVTGT